jgi:NADPH:quinone reductase-like Zn-dependent oxidoreductase
MKAVVMTAAGKPDVLPLQELPIPAVQGRELLTAVAGR